MLPILLSVNQPVGVGRSGRAPYARRGNLLTGTYVSRSFGKEVDGALKRCGSATRVTGFAAIGEQSEVRPTRNRGQLNNRNGAIHYEVGFPDAEVLAASDLWTVVEAWPNLPADARAAILSVVRQAGGDKMVGDVAAQ
jgi:hypothetical protein